MGTGILSRISRGKNYSSKRMPWGCQWPVRGPEHLKCYWDENQCVFFLDFFILSWRSYPEDDKKIRPRLIWRWFTSVKAARKCVNFVRHYSNDKCSSPQFLSSGVPSMTSSYHLAKPSRPMCLVNRVIGNAVFFKLFVFFVRGRFRVEFRQG